VGWHVGLGPPRQRPHTNRAVTSPPQTTTQKAHPHLGPILIWRKGTLVARARTLAFQL